MKTTHASRHSKTERKSRAVISKERKEAARRRRGGGLDLKEKQLRGHPDPNAYRSPHTPFACTGLYTDACFPFVYRRAQERVLLHGRAGLDGGGKGNDPENEKNDNQNSILVSLPRFGRQLDDVYCIASVSVFTQPHQHPARDSVAMCTHAMPSPCTRSTTCL